MTYDFNNVSNMIDLAKLAQSKIHWGEKFYVNGDDYNFDITSDNYYNWKDFWDTAEYAYNAGYEKVTITEESSADNVTFIR